MMKCLGITCAVIRYALFPMKDSPPDRERSRRLDLLPDQEGTTVLVTCEHLSALPADLHALLTVDGKLDLFFSGCSAGAAPFILFRLKRQGFSSCRAVATPEGVHVFAAR